MNDAPWTPGPWGVEPESVGDWNGYAVTHTGGRVQSPNEATARLIAAAPEMAALLIEIEERGHLPTFFMDDLAPLLARIRGVPAPASPS